MIGCFFDNQDTAPPASMKTYPLLDFLSIAQPAKSESQNTFKGCPVLWYTNFKSLVFNRYLKIRLTAFQSDTVGFAHLWLNFPIAHATSSLPWRHTLYAPQPVCTTYCPPVRYPQCQDQPRTPWLVVSTLQPHE